MSKNFTLYNAHAESLDQDSLLEYKEVISKHPYCQYAHLMFLLNLKRLGDDHTYRQALPYTAIIVPDRTRLKEQVEQIDLIIEKEKVGSDPEVSGTPETSEEFNTWENFLSTKLFGNQTEKNGNTPAFRPLGPGEKSTTANRPKLTSEQRNSRRKQTDAIIDQFLKSGDHTISVDEDFDYSQFDPDEGRSTQEDFSFGSETLAEMYLKNGSPKKAIEVYKHLGLKFPEKNRYFASLIQKVKKEYSIK